MRIADVRVTQSSVRPAQSYVTSIDARLDGGPRGRTRDRVLVEIETDDGVVGYGTCAPDPTWPRGLNAQAVAAIIEHEYRPLLVGRDPRPLGAIVPMLERAAVDVPFALAAIDLALWDVAGKAQGRSVADLLGGRVRDSVRLHHPIGMQPVDAVAVETREAIEAGYLDFKLKVGGPDFDAELAAVETVRRLGGDRARIRVDANQGWSAEEAIGRIEALNEHRLVLVEQPVPYWDLDGMRHVRRTTGVPILADESCFGPADVVRIARAEAADVVNVKLMKCGGLWNARKMTAVAEAAGLTCFVGGMAEESEVAVAAGFHLAVTQEIVRHPTGILSGLTERPPSEPPWEIRGARAYPRERVIGLGADPDPAARARPDPSR